MQAPHGWVSGDVGHCAAAHVPEPGVQDCRVRDSWPPTQAPHGPQTIFDAGVQVPLPTGVQVVRVSVRGGVQYVEPLQGGRYPGSAGFGSTQVRSSSTQFSSSVGSSGLLTCRYVRVVCQAPHGFAVTIAHALTHQPPRWCFLKTESHPLLKMFALVRSGMPTSWGQELESWWQ